MYSYVLICGVFLAHFSSASVAQDIVFEDTENLKNCGRSKIVTVSPLVINGTEAHIGSFPWHAGLYYRTVTNGTVTWEQRCGGSLITDRFILSAAHCVYDTKTADVRVALGKYFRSWDHYEDGEQKRNVSRISYPYDFNTQTFYFDIALLLLDEKIKLGSVIMPVCTGLSGDSNYLLNKSLFVVGWGQTTNDGSGNSSETLLYNDATFMPPRACMEYTPYTYVLFEKFCTKKYDSDVSVAQHGDSGGGLTVVHEGLHYILGIVSVKFGLVGKSRTFFTNITWPTHLSWIQNEVRVYDSKFSWSGNDEATNHSSRPPPGAMASTVTQSPSVILDVNSCKLPDHPKNGAYAALGCSSNNTQAACRNTPGTAVPSDWVLKYTCNSGYSLNNHGVYSICSNGVWQNPLDCIKFCPPLNSPNVNAMCLYGGTEVNCSLPMKPNTQATVVCKPQYKEAFLTEERANLLCLRNGEWSHPLSCTPGCGVVSVSEPLILKGSPVKIGEFPWLAAIYRKTELQVELKTIRWEQQCGGTLITTHIVITAAHCLVKYNEVDPPNPTEIKVGLGKYYRDYYVNEGIIADVKTVLVHPNYVGRPTLYALNIGLLDLVSRVQLSPTIMPACVDWNAAFRPAPDAVGVVAGWGYTAPEKPGSSDVALSARLKYINYGDCWNRISADSRPYLAPDKFCGGDIDGSAVDKGDSGGGLTFLKDGIYYLVGVVSTKIPRGSAALFTDLTKEEPITWLEKMKNQLSQSHSEL